MHPRLTSRQLAAYDKNGFHIERSIFSRDEIQSLALHFDDLAEAGVPVPGHWTPQPGGENTGDPLLRYPRMMNPHRLDEYPRNYYLDARIESVLTTLLNDEPVAIQSMFYWKPPGARGQAFHQDNYYTRVKPYSCIAAWIAVDPATPENGGLYVVPGTQDMEIQCPQRGDMTKTFYPDYVPVPEGFTPVPAVLEPGDVLFFEGNILHGSNPNASTTVWRRSYVCHYMPRSATYLAQPFLPALAFDGSEVNFEPNGDLGPCGGREGTQATALV